ncbi:unnamed protein product [marine sediment metagenome]|uniref:Uncharacterized protein n=1 Tax=marine sediment metagenome TaxID=412755 RepID=X1EVU9_9ZZZZ
MARINIRTIDAWTLIHFIGAVAIASVILFFTRDIALVFVLGSVIVLMWEGVEVCLKKAYDVFNIPFGRETVFEVGGNIAFDIIAGELALIIVVVVYEMFFNI